MFVHICHLHGFILLFGLCVLHIHAVGSSSYAKRVMSDLYPTTSLKDLDLRLEPPLSFREQIVSTMQGIISTTSLSTSATTNPNTPTVAGTGLLHRLSSLTSKLYEKKRLLILMSDTGGGHRASAQAIDQALQDQFPGRIDVTIKDIWTDHAKWPFNKFVPMYRFVAKRPILWRAFYAYGSFPPTKILTELDSQRLCYTRFKDAMEAANPDFVVSVHPLCQLIPISIVREMNRKRVDKPRIPFVTVVTDLGSAHQCWFDRRADAVYVPSEAVRKIALRNSIDPKKIIMKGLPIRPPFWRASEPKELARRALGIAQNAKTVLLMGGGDGVGGLGNIATEIAKKLRELDLSTQLVVICGHNTRLWEQLQQKLVKHTNNQQQRCSNSCPPGIPSTLSASFIMNQTSTLIDNLVPTKLKVSVQGFVTNIDQWMGAADLLVTKAGPGTIAEAMTRGLPIVLSSFLPGQESGNVPYVVKGGFGVYAGKIPSRIANKVCELVSDESLLCRMSKRARKLSTPEATRAIAAEIAFVLLNGKNY